MDARYGSLKGSGQSWGSPHRGALKRGTSYISFVKTILRKITRNKFIKRDEDAIWLRETFFLVLFKSLIRLQERIGTSGFSQEREILSRFLSLPLSHPLRVKVIKPGLKKPGFYCRFFFGGFYKWNLKNPGFFWAFSNFCKKSI